MRLQNVSWSDEPQILLHHLDGWVRILNKRHENMDPSCLLLTNEAGGSFSGK